MGIGNWRAKWDALRQTMAGQPKLELVKPKHRTSGPVPRIVPEDWFDEREQQAMGSLPICKGCAEWTIVGVQGLIAGRYCARCARERGLPPLGQHEQPPAA